MGIELKTWRIRYIKKLFGDSPDKKTILENMGKLWGMNSRQPHKDQYGRMTGDTFAEELNIFNIVYGSKSKFYQLFDKELIAQMYKVSRAEVYQGAKNARDRSKLSKEFSIFLEDWLYDVDESRFMDTLDEEISVMEDVIVGLMLYILGGFLIPIDKKKKHLGKWLIEDTAKLGREPKDIILLSNIHPWHIIRYTYFKITSLLLALNRVFTVQVDKEAIQYMYDQMRLLTHDNTNEAK